MTTTAEAITHPLVGARVTDNGLVGTTRTGRITAVHTTPDGFSVTVLWPNGSYCSITPTAGRYSVALPS